MKDIYKNIKDVLTARQRIQFIGIGILITLQSLMETAAVYLIFPFMYVMMGTEDIEDNRWMRVVWEVFGCKDSKDLLIIIAVILICTYVLKNVAAIIVKWIQCRWMASLHQNLMTSMYRMFFSRKYSSFLNMDAADVTRAVTDDINRFYEMLKAAFDVLQRVLISFFLIITLISINPFFVAVAFIILVFVILALNKIVSGRINKYGKIGMDILTQAINWVNQSMGLVKNILINRKQKYYVDHFNKYAGALYQSRTSYEVISDIPGKFVESLCISGIFLYIILLLLQGENIETMISQFAVFALALIKILPSIVSINSDINRIKYHEPAITNIRMNLNSNDTDVKCAQVDDLKNFTSSIKLENVSFKYDDSESYIYENVNFSIKSGTSVAFIGKTGSGKTTLADIILGLHEPKSGKVTVDGKNISENRNSWGNLIGYVPQNIYLANASIAQNVAFGEDNIDYDRVYECIEDAKLTDHISSLPDGVETLIGENGVRLSGGQRQRLGIARALYNHPQFLVMDEATSALDTETEAAITESIKSLSHKITLLIIAHRINTIIDCDYIYRVENGRIEEVEDRESL